MKRVLLATAALALSLLWSAGSVVAHDGAAAYMIVSADFVLPGQPFEVMVADIGIDAPVDFTIVKDDRSELLGTSRAAPDGHLMTDLVVPADFPQGGYAQLFATVPDVVWTSTWVYVGERTSDTPPPPAGTAMARWWTDPSVIVLAVLVVGVVGAIGYLVFRPRLATPKTITSPPPSRRSTGKRSRRP